MAKYDGREGYQGKVITSPVKAIRAFCVECAGADNVQNVKICGGEKSCPLYPFRFGVNPYSSAFGVSKPFPSSKAKEGQIFDSDAET